MTDTTQLLPCPFCGGPARQSSGGAGPAMRFGTGCGHLRGCPASLFALDHATQKMADAVWNRRLCHDRIHAAASEAGAVPIYLVNRLAGDEWAGGGWYDTTEEAYHLTPGANRRIVYAAPPAENALPAELPDPHGCNKCQHPDCGRFHGPRKVECRAMADNACAREDAQTTAATADAQSGPYEEYEDAEGNVWARPISAPDAQGDRQHAGMDGTPAWEPAKDAQGDDVDLPHIHGYAPSQFSAECECVTIHQAKQYARHAVLSDRAALSRQPSAGDALTAGKLREPKNGDGWRVEWWNESARMMLPDDKRLDSFQAYKNGTLVFTIKEADAARRAATGG